MTSDEDASMNHHEAHEGFFVGAKDFSRRALKAHSGRSPSAHQQGDGRNYELKAEMFARTALLRNVPRARDQER
jgi:hypothetical protein